MMQHWINHKIASKRVTSNWRWRKANLSSSLSPSHSYWLHVSGSEL